ncbi:hypothetical protein BC830DRAFT_1078774 [Chytriomyces sp. MP71]|nr:hypothetical protein BC830DRAFT_1078774 [Chytriomyces sp. MP71]
MNASKTEDMWDALNRCDPVTQLESTQAEKKLEASGAKDLDEVSHLELLMNQMDNTYDALGELETRAEDILAKLDAFLIDNGHDGINGNGLKGEGDGNVASLPVAILVEGTGCRGLNGKGDAIAFADLTPNSVVSPVGLNSSAMVKKGTASTGILSALATSKKSKGK